ncbi:MAG: hypothetical protein ACK4WM_11660 [Thermoflexales bacterium]
MTTSGTSVFDLDMADIFEEAFERCGVELRSGYHLRTARRSLELMMAEWANRGVNLWTIEEGTIPLEKGVSQYAMPADTVDVVDHVVRTGAGANQSDVSITRVGVKTYANIPNKEVLGRPTQFWFHRRSGKETPSGTQYPIITVWPVPDRDDFYTLVLWRLRRIQDAGDSSAVADIPFRFLPCLVAGLAYHLSRKLPGALERSALLKADYEEQWQLAADEDREKASLFIIPRG